MHRCESPQCRSRGRVEAEHDGNAPISANFSSLSGDSVLLGVGVAALGIPHTAAVG